MDAFAEALDAGVPPEFAQAHLKDAESALEEIVGLIGTEEVLDRVFPGVLHWKVKDRRPWL